MLPAAGHPCRRARLRARARLLVAVLALGATVGTGSSQADPPPSSPPDFARSVSPHGSLFSTTSGGNDRPVLVAHVQFTDMTAPAGGDYADVFFGAGFGSVADYFERGSFGHLLLTPAPETEGTPNDGVVRITLGPFDDYSRRHRGDPPPPVSEAERGRAVLDAVDPFVDFAGFDRDGDGALSPAELLIVGVRVTPAESCGRWTSVAAGPPLDGMDVTRLQYSEGTTLTDRITFAHEISHQALGVRDYHYKEGSLDLHGPTCARPDDTWWGYNGWKKLHFGWITPTVVTRDGFHSVGRADVTGQAFILHDPSKGSDDYLLVENRERTPGSYDKDASDSGLVVWRVDETRFASGPTSLVSPRPGAGSEAWDPSDPETPQRTVTTTWADGTAAAVAIRAIGARGARIRAYFDVPGPGVLVDTDGLRAAPVARGAMSPLPIAVRNTGEAAATFDVTIVGLPAGWTTSTRATTLGAQETAEVPVLLTLPATASAGVHTLTASGQSRTDPAVRSTASLRVRVRGDPRGGGRPARPTTGMDQDWTAVRRHVQKSPAQGR